MAEQLIVPGLNGPLSQLVYEESSHVYKTLIDDKDLDDEDERLKEHLSALFLMIDKYNLLDLLCIHSAHSHFPLPKGTVLYGVDGKSPICRRTKPTPIKDIVDEHVHGHIFVVVNSKLQAYEFQEGDAPDFSCHNLDQFLQEYIDFVEVKKLDKLAGLQMRYGNFESLEMWECFEDNESIMMDASAAKLRGYKPGRETGWVGTKENGHIRVCGVQRHNQATGKCYIDQNSPLQLVSL